jgi:hypothetical protein
MALHFGTAFAKSSAAKPNSSPAMKKHYAAASLLVGALALGLGACSTISHYDQAAYEHAVNAKVDALALMKKAIGSYDAHQKEIESLLTELDKAYEYDRGRPLNVITVAEWNILRDPEGNLFGGFLKVWKEKGSLDPTFVAEKKAQIAEAFDQIIQLESGKLKRLLKN